MPWDDIVSVANKVEARAKIQRSTHLDQRYLKKKQPLKIGLTSWDN